MDEVTLKFSDTHSLADFILTNAISNAEVNSVECKLTTFLSQTEKEKALNNYNAVEIKKHRFSFIDEEED